MNGDPTPLPEDERIEKGLAAELRATMDRVMQLKLALINRGWSIHIIVNGIESPQVDIQRTQKL